MCILIMLYSIFSVFLVWEFKVEIALRVGVFTASWGQNICLGGEARSVASPSCPEDLSRLAGR